MNFQSQSAKSNNLRLQQPLSVCSNLRRSLVEEIGILFYLLLSMSPEVRGRWETPSYSFSICEVRFPQSFAIFRETLLSLLPLLSLSPLKKSAKNSTPSTLHSQLFYYLCAMKINFYTDSCNYRLPQKRLMRRWLQEVAQQEGGYEIAEINYVFCSAERHRAMNIEFLGHDYFTDIITFDDSNLKEGFIAGDIFIDIETVRDNARLYGATARQEMHRVIVHGVLHLCGQKDKTPRTEKQMHKKEDKYLALLDKLRIEN